jgi:hypothetical protein
MSELNPEVRFRHFEFYDGHITVAYQLDDNRDSEQRYVRAAAAFCSPYDQFTKKKGRLISEGRLKAGKCVDAIMPVIVEENFQYQVTDFVEDVVFSGLIDLPNWVKKHWAA